MQLSILKTAAFPFLFLLIQHIPTLTAGSAIAIPSTEDTALLARDSYSEFLDPSDEYDDYSDEDFEEEQPEAPHAFLKMLSKRRGGGGGGRGGGSSGRGGTGSPSTNTNVRGGGTTSSGSYYSRGGQNVYAGGSTSPYRAGSALPTSGRTPLFLGAGALGFGAGALLFAGHPFYYYGPYGYRYPYYNNSTRQNESLAVSCVCAEYNPCGCDDVSSSDVVDQELDDGTANITTINGTKTVVINGTLDNGTDGSGAGSWRVGAGWGGLTRGVWGTSMLVAAMLYAL